MRQVGLASWAGLRDWRSLLLSLSLPALLLLPLGLLIPESPRWLLSQVRRCHGKVCMPVQGRKEEYAAVLRRAAQVNRRPLLTIVPAPPGRAGLLQRGGVVQCHAPSPPRLTRLLAWASIIIANW